MTTVVQIFRSGDGACDAVFCFCAVLKTVKSVNVMIQSIVAVVAVLDNVQSVAVCYLTDREEPMRCTVEGLMLVAFSCLEAGSVLVPKFLTYLQN